MVKRYLIAIIVLFVLTVGHAHAQNNDRQEIRIVGSQAVLTLMHVLSEAFAQHFDHDPPAIIVTGAGGGFDLFCQSVGFDTPDINASSRPIAPAELELCQSNGVTKITEIAIGRAAFVVATAGEAPQMALSAAQLHSAIAARVIQDGQIIQNPYENLRDIDPLLPDQPIRFMGPAAGTPDFDAFIELVLNRGCRQSLQELNLAQSEQARFCTLPRTDRTFRYGERDQNARLQWLLKRPKAFGFINFTLYDENRGRLHAAVLDGEAPSRESIATGRYALSRPIYLYIKSSHIPAIEGLQQFLYEATSERAIGPEGYLVEKGLLSLDDRGRNRARELAFSLESLVQ